MQFGEGRILEFCLSGDELKGWALGRKRWQVRYPRRCPRNIGAFAVGTGIGPVIRAAQSLRS